MTEGFQRNRFRLNPADHPAGYYLRTGCFLQHPESELGVPCPRRFPFSRLSKQLYFFFRSTEGESLLTTPYHDSCIGEIDLAEGEHLIIKLDHVLGFTTNMFFECQWKIDLVGFLTLQFRYFYFTGPGRIIVFGLGDLGRTMLEDETVDLDSGSVIGWSNELEAGASTKSTWLSAAMGKEEICLDHFTGSGLLLTQASTIRKLPRRFNDDRNNSSFWDIINALTGLRI